MSKKKCPLCGNKQYRPGVMEQHTLPTAPMSIGDGYDRTTSVEILVCAECGWWMPCGTYGETRGRLESAGQQGKDGEG